MKKTLLRTIALTASLTLFTVNPAFSGGSIGHGDFSVYNNAGKLSSKLSGHNPVEDGALLVCNGKCLLKSQGISLVASDNSHIAVASENDTYKLYVKEGEVKFIINNNARKLAFYTPQGTYTVAEVIFNAASAAVVRGSVVVDPEGETTISVSEGRLVFTTADGLKTVDAQQKIVLAMVPGGITQAGVTNFFGTIGITSVPVGLTLAGITAVAIAGVANNTGGGGGVTPPPSPPVDPGPRRPVRIVVEPPPPPVEPPPVLDDPPPAASPAHMTCPPYCY